MERCKNRDNGCEWTGANQEQLETHLLSCGYTVITCTNECQANHEVVEVLRKDLPDLLTNWCPRRQYQCPHCRELGEHQEQTTSHLEACPMVEVSCPNKPCQASILRCRIEAHRFTCDYEHVICKYAKVGCKERPLRKDLKKHEEDIKLGSCHHKLGIRTPSKRSTTVFSSTSSKGTVFTTSPFRFKLINFKTYKSESEEFFSPSFYTSRCGYKMCIEVYANGNGSGKGTHVSVFACILKGENDNFLTWPFTCTVTFELLNQLEDRNHYKKIARFSNEDITKRVDCDELAVAGGIPKFISHSELIENSPYLRNDTLVFRISVQLPMQSYSRLPIFDFIKPRVVNQAFKFSVELSFIKPVEVLQITSKRMSYCDASLGFCIDIPEGAVSEGFLLQLEVGVCLYGPFVFPGNLNPIAPILMLCPQNDVQLNKELRITLPHILSHATEKDVDDLGIEVIKADHTNLFLARECVFDNIIGESNLSFHAFDNYEFATFTLSNFSFVTLRANTSREDTEGKKYCICPLLPPPETVSSGNYTYPLCVTYFMAPCLEVGLCS